MLVDLAPGSDVADAPRAAFPAACSMLDKPVLMLLIEAFALLTSTSTTSSSLLLSAMESDCWLGAWTGEVRAERDWTASMLRTR